MKEQRLYLLITFFLLITGNLTARGQSTLCPSNIDFENGNLSNWECRTGRVESLAGVNTVLWENYTINPLNHKVISRASAGQDTYGGFPEVSPNGSAYSVKLGNNYFQNISAEGMFYTFRIPDTATLYSILFYYAVVFQDPQHTPDQQPRFRTSVFNVTDNEMINCSNFDFTASASLPGFQVSPVDNTVIYKDWTPVTLNLAGYAGKTIRLEFITSDCTFKGHFGYAYIDVNSSCSGAIKGNIVCENAEEMTLVAPYGFQTYKWFADNTFSTLLSSSQNLVLNPVPPDGTALPVIVGPYPGFGCPDTIDALIKRVNLPPAIAGADAFVCRAQSTQLGTSPVSGYGYNWTPASFLLGSNIADPYTTINLAGATTFYLAVTDSTTGCMNYDTVTVTPVIIDTTLIRTGDTAFCMNKKVNTSLSVLFNQGTIQWLEDNRPVNGATSNFYNPHPDVTSIYKAVLTKSGCIENTREVIIRRIPAPKAGFTIGPSSQCINGPVTLTNKSIEPPGVSTNYLWELTDGRTFTTANVNLSFNSPGQKSILLTAKTTEGCADSTSSVVNILDKCGVFVPSAFSPGNDGRNDLFKPYFLGAYKLKQFSVYDRNGVLVYTTNKIGDGWNGMYKGIRLTTSVLVWMMEYEDDTGKINFLKGTVTLVR